MAIARGIAAARGDRDLTATHIAAGIFREGANPGLGALWYAGLSETAIKTLGFELENSLGEAPGHIPPRLVTIDLTPGEEEVVHAAEIEVSRLGDPYLGTEHLLLAILRSDKSVAQPFAERGITLEKYEAGLSAVLRGDPPPEQPGAV
jgi:ATP-dependent Clp protease ATP-binding subunit ClpA